MDFITHSGNSRFSHFFLYDVCNFSLEKSESIKREKKMYEKKLNDNRGSRGYCMGHPSKCRGVAHR
jgi:hypothetical protein